MKASFQYPSINPPSQESRFHEVIGTGGSVDGFLVVPNSKAFGKVFILEVATTDPSYMVGLMTTNDKLVYTFSEKSFGSGLKPHTFEQKVDELAKQGGNNKYTILVQDADDFKLLRDNLCFCYGKPKLNLPVLKQACARLNGINPLLKKAEPVPVGFDPFEL